VIGRGAFRLVPWSGLEVVSMRSASTQIFKIIDAEQQPSKDALDAACESLGVAEPTALGKKCGIFDLYTERVTFTRDMCSTIQSSYFTDSPSSSNRNNIQKQWLESPVASHRSSSSEPNCTLIVPSCSCRQLR